MSYKKDMKESEKLAIIVKGLVETAGYGATSSVARLLGVAPPQISKMINSSKNGLSELTLKTHNWVQSSHDSKYNTLPLIKQVSAYGYVFRMRDTGDGGQIVTWTN